MCIADGRHQQLDDNDVVEGSGCTGCSVDLDATYSSEVKQLVIARSGSKHDVPSSVKRTLIRVYSLEMHYE